MSCSVSKVGDRIIGLDPTKISKETRDGWRKKRPSKKATPETKASSRKLDLSDRDDLSPKDREMVDAVENLRREVGDDKGNDYASIRYIDGDGAERILVTRSDSVHSEGMGGNYLLDRLGPDKIKAVYTERSPVMSRRTVTSG
jgi:hypothetical protein